MCTAFARGAASGACSARVVALASSARRLTACRRGLHRYGTLTPAVTDAFRCILVDLPGCGESHDVSNDADVHTISSYDAVLCLTCVHTTADFARRACNPARPGMPTRWSLRLTRCTWKRSPSSATRLVVRVPSPLAAVRAPSPPDSPPVHLAMLLAPGAVGWVLATGKHAPRVDAIVFVAPVPARGTPHGARGCGCVCVYAHRQHGTHEPLIVAARCYIRPV